MSVIEAVKTLFRIMHKNGGAWPKISFITLMEQWKQLILKHNHLHSKYRLQIASSRERRSRGKSMKSLMFEALWLARKSMGKNCLTHNVFLICSSSPKCVQPDCERVRNVVEHQASNLQIYERLLFCCFDWHHFESNMKLTRTIFSLFKPVSWIPLPILMNDPLSDSHTT